MRYDATHGVTNTISTIVVVCYPIRESWAIRLVGWAGAVQTYTKEGTLYNASMKPEDQNPTIVNLTPVLAADEIRLKKIDTEYPSADIQCIVSDGDQEQIVTSIRLTVD